MGMGLTLLMMSSIMGATFFFFTSTIEEDHRWVHLSIALVGVALNVFSIFCALKMPHSEYEYITTATEDIVALNDNNLVNGRGYYRSCRIDENLYYQYIVDLHDGSYVANKVNASTTYIRETDDQPRVEWREKTQKYLCFHYTEPYNVIYVPEGCITYDFTIDLE